jgi:hypothetical protein
LNIWSKDNGTIPVDIVVPYPISDIARQLLTDREVMMNVFLKKSVIFIESSDLDEFIKLDHTKSQVNLEILLSGESESDDSSVGASEAEEIAGYLSGGSELAVVTEDEEDVGGFPVSTPVCFVGFLVLYDIDSYGEKLLNYRFVQGITRSEPLAENTVRDSCM